MEKPTLYLVRYYDPALSYLPKIGSLLYEKMKKYHNQLIRYDDIDKLIVQLEVAQNTITTRNPRLKRIKIDRHDENDRVRIDTPIKNNDPEELFVIEPINGYLFDCLAIPNGTEGQTSDEIIKLIHRRLDVLQLRDKQMDLDVARSPNGFSSTDGEQHAKVKAQVECLETLLEIIKGNKKLTDY